MERQYNTSMGLDYSWIVCVCFSSLCSTCVVSMSIGNRNVFAEGDIVDGGKGSAHNISQKPVHSKTIPAFQLADSPFRATTLASNNRQIPYTMHQFNRTTAAEFAVLVKLTGTYGNIPL